MKIRPSFRLGFFLVSLVLVGSLLQVSCSKQPNLRSLPIRDVTQSERLELAARENEKSIYRIDVIAEGELDGKAFVSAGDSYGEEIGPGKFRAKLGGDWYTATCFVSYKPSTVRAGHVTVYYDFGSLDSTRTNDSAPTSQQIK